MLLNGNPAIDFIHGRVPNDFIDNILFYSDIKSDTNYDIFQNCSSLLIVYEGYEDSKEMLQMDEDLLSVTSQTADINSFKGQGDNQSRPMEDDSHSGNCSYDADASNDSIELNLSLDEQQTDTQPITHAYTNHTQANNLPVSALHWQTWKNNDLIINKFCF